ncbi:prepilin-type N-terminal cleavage/methylation domain-containing protein [Iodobacter ciconiae]|uniref:Prepilin-type N-terminal cleavage/methylation domain-containing protein n=1 Tax=Iodobacter ciconiae TaxID=2496266 RepID=A0A3S8ZUT2_9NEIS|nr:prepilin-type N-terminal cleavage/methylation domain-containing protein [Iodobacter ciconiae]AZN37218.1 prepilin-type N-terminal cleavage/methylation domain-containing protein [Iodobacter ciconiae]
MKVDHSGSRGKQSGFTLVELAIVLVIIGLILGMAFKGKDLIDGAKVKSAQTSANKIQSGMNIYFERYGAYPGDGCPAGTTTPAGCIAARNGLLTAAEGLTTLPLLTGTNILSASDIRSPFGVNWAVAVGGAGNTTANRNYLTLTTTVTAAADVRLVCAMDQQFDDGVPTTGNIRSTGLYAPAPPAIFDCWAMNAQASLSIQILP